jgi:hypothetical protein
MVYATPNYLRYVSSRAGSNSWAQHPQLIHEWRQGRLSRVLPLTLELSPTLVCQLGCPECPFGTARLAAGRGRIRPGQLACPDDLRTASEETTRAIIDRCANAGVLGALWTGGGEPTIWEPLPEMLRYSHQRGLANGLYTNAIQIALTHPGRGSG